MTVDGTAHTLLYVDGQASASDSMTTLLEREGFRVLTAQRGREAFSIVEQEKIHLILLGIDIPEMDGYEICTRLKKDPRSSETPVLLTSLFGEEEEIHRCFEVGAADYVNKGIHAEELCARIKTQIRLAEVTRNENRERRLLSLALGNMRDVALGIDTAGIIHFANAAAEEWFGGPIIGSNYFDISRGRETICGVELIRWTIENREQTSSRIEDGSEIRKVTVDPLSSPVGDMDVVFIVSRDLREETKYTDSLRQAQKMASIGRLAGGIAHDLNNILGGMIGYISLAKAKIEKDHAIYSILEHVDSASERASDVISKLLEFASVQEINPEPIDLNQEIHRLMPLMKSSISTSLLMDLQLGDQLPTITIDPSQIKQLLMNLVYAVSSAGRTAGMMTVTTETIIINGRSMVCLRTSFRGAGSEMGTVDSFTDYNIAENASLGLAIVQDIVDLYEGDFEFDSEDEFRFSFTVYLPADEESQLTAGAGASGACNHILVVDDELIILQMMEDCFEMLGYHGFFAPSGSKGLEIFQENRDKIGLVILDLVMPGMSGEEVLLSLREIDPDIKIIISSAFSAARKGQVQTKLNANAFLSKPFKINELQDMVQRIAGIDF